MMRFQFREFARIDIGVIILSHIAWILSLGFLALHQANRTVTDRRENRSLLLLFAFVSLYFAVVLRRTITYHCICHCIGYFVCC